MPVRRGSVRTRAALGATAVVAVALVAAGLAVVAVLRGGLADNARLKAEAAAREVAAQVTDVRAGKVGGIDGLDDEGPVQVVDGKGEVLGASEELRGRPAVADFHRAEEKRPDPDPTTVPADPDDPDDDSDDDDSDDDSGDDDAGDDGPDGDDDTATVTPSPEPVEVDRASEEGTVSLPVDEDGQVTYGEDATGQQDFSLVAVQSATSDGTPVTVYAAASLADQEQAVSSVSRAMLTGLPAVLVVVAGVTWLVTRRALRPVEGIRQGMAEITASTDLSRRVPEPAARDEVARLARTTNETLSALETAVERQRRFVADASHELRSPIASLRTQLEVGAAHQELLDVDGAVQDTVRLQRLAADLLLLARLDAGERPGHTPVALPAFVQEELAQRVGDRHPVRVGELADLEVAGSRGQLARVLGNLLDNAQRHAATQVRVSVRPDGDWAVLEVADDGDGVPEIERERIFERFVRLDDARTRDDGGAGLGLAIARDVALRHGGTLTVGTAEEGGARFALRLPVAADR
ncbi:sensor histidine kinase [Streptomyces gobiensis]|uniref:sensor histidine kinase n=1 Tax=Streptomyces gobiensis TaxID=2875706 RepID=UPI001E4C5888|nr:HAMP domain-containing sensor histidine kinase [Streptomyces gobiensis]UGY90707.1 HAMP domain-containing histidine kinase [Streptomyces gobiensis]